MQNPTYLVLSEYNVYHFRWPIPIHLLADSKRRYCKVSLGTREPKTALHLAKVLSCNARMLFERIGKEQVDYTEIKQMVQAYLQRELQNEKERLEWLGPEKLAEEVYRLSSGEKVWGLQFDPEEVHEEELKHETACLVALCKAEGLDRLAEEQDIHREWDILRQCYRKAMPKAYGALANYIKELENSYDFDSALLLSTASSQTTMQPLLVEHSPVTLQQAVDKYIAMHTQDQVWDENTHDGKRAVFSVLIELIGGDFDIAKMDAQAARQLRDDIKRIPRNRNKNPLVRNLPLKHAMALENVETISAVTAGKYFNTIRSLFDWCATEEYIARNPFSSIKLSVDKKKKKVRTAFTPEQMQQIRSALNPNGIHYRYWGSLIGIYTGARLNEIAQLELADFQQKDGIWYFNMNDDGDNKTLKTAAAKRYVPIHSELLDLGIIEELKRLEKLGHTRFLHELRFCKKNGYGKKLGHYFNQVLLPTLGIKKQRNAEVFHALRHTFVTRLYQAGITQSIVDTIIGHERSGTSQQVYFKEGYKLSQLKDAMDKFDPLTD